ncbi:MAG: GFA family protein [Paracoccaceae bacterium]
MYGKCLCGAVTIRIAGHVPRVGACHCAMCRRWSGSAYFAFEADPAGLTVEGPVRRYRSSSFAERAFCAECGSHLWLKDDNGPYELMPGPFDGATGFPLASVVYDDCAPAYLPLGDAPRRRTKADYEASEAHIADTDGGPS